MISLIFSRKTVATLSAVFCLWSAQASAVPVTDDYDTPSASPTMIISTTGGEQTLTEYTGSAPINAHFKANVENEGMYTPLYEWNIYKAGHEDSPYLVRHDAEFDYQFMESGKSYISLQISFVNGNDTIDYTMTTPFMVDGETSVLSVPNAFSPNNDGTNEIFGVKKEGYQSIVEFHGYIFNRHGKKLYEWTDITGGWDGTYHGHPVADGAYYVRIDAKGADGKRYHIKKAVNLLRGYTKNSAAGN